MTHLIDYEAAIENWIDSIQPESGREYEFSIASSESTGWRIRVVDGSDSAIDEIEDGSGITKESALADFCDWNDIELESYSEPLGVMDWYQVFPSIGGQLKDRGLLIVEVFGMYLLGYSATGIPLHTNSVVIGLWAESHKDQIVEIFAHTEVGWPIESTARGFKMTIEPVGELVHISRITHKDIPADCVLTPETVELIQNLRLDGGLQFAPFPDLKSFYAVAYPLKPYHFDAVRIARITSSGQK